MSKLTAIATAKNQDRFSDATLYDITYVSCAETDVGTWGSLRRMVESGAIKPVVLCRDRDGRVVGDINLLM
jgi:hypothetical protein